MTTYEWIKEVENAEEHLTGDAKLIEELVGLDNMIKFYSNYGGLSFYFSTKDFTELRKKYIKQHIDESKTSRYKICRELGISLKTLTGILKEIKEEKK